MCPVRAGPAVKIRRASGQNNGCPPYQDRSRLLLLDMRAHCACGDGRLGAWLATTARRESLRIVTRRQRERRDGADEELQTIPDGGIGVEESLLSSERDATLLRAVRELDDRCQRLLRVLSASPPPRYDA